MGVAKNSDTYGPVSPLLALGPDPPLRRHFAVHIHHSVPSLIEPLSQTTRLRESLQVPRARTFPLQRSCSPCNKRRRHSRTHRAVSSPNLGRSPGTAQLSSSIADIHHIRIRIYLLSSFVHAHPVSLTAPRSCFRPVISPICFPILTRPSGPHAARSDGRRARISGLGRLLPLFVFLNFLARSRVSRCL